MNLTLDTVHCLLKLSTITLETRIFYNSVYQYNLTSASISHTLVKGLSNLRSSTFNRLRIRIVCVQQSLSVILPLLFSKRTHNLLLIEQYHRMKRLNYYY